MQLPIRGGHGRFTTQPTQRSANSSDSGPRDKQHDEKEVDRQQKPICGAVDDRVETSNMPLGGQGDDGYAGIVEAVLWSQSRTIERTTYCDEDASEYVVRPRVRLPGPNLNGKDEKLGRNHTKLKQHCTLIGPESLTDNIIELKPSSSAENGYASENRARLSSSSSSTSSSENFFDAVEHQPSFAPPESSMQPLFNGNSLIPIERISTRIHPQNPNSPCC